MRYAVRSLIRTPSFTLVAILTLAVGIATTTTIFAIVDELAFKPWRGTHNEHVYRTSLHIPDYETISREPPAGVSAVAAFEVLSSQLLQTPGRAERVTGWRVAGGYASVFGIRAARTLDQ